jgi:hypothetical protein
MDMVFQISGVALAVFFGIFGVLAFKATAASLKAAEIANQLT